jgi:hypothetical protein
MDVVRHDPEILALADDRHRFACRAVALFDAP